VSYIYLSFSGGAKEVVDYKSLISLWVNHGTGITG
jgi:hypothetical protein